MNRRLSQKERFQSKIPEKISELKHEKDSYGRQRAAEFLGTWGNGQVIKPLYEALMDTSPWVRYRAIEAIGKKRKFITDKRIVNAITNMAKYDTDPYVKAAAISAFVKLKGKEAVEPLMKMIKSSRGRVRRRIILSLGKLKAKEAIPEIRKMLDSSIFCIRLNAIRVLGNFGDVESLDKIKEIAKDNKQRLWVRDGAEEAVKKLKKKMKRMN